MVISHSEILFDGIIFAGRDINRMISAVAQTLSDQAGIAFIRFYTLSLLSEHSGRRQNDAFEPGIGKLVVQRIPKASCLVTAFNRIIIIKTEFHLQRFNEADDLFVVRGNLYFSKDSVF